MINGQMVGGFAINALLTVALMSSGTTPESEVGAFMLIFVALSFLGILIIQSGRVIVGARVFMVGSLLFVPVGLIGAMGARKLMDQYNQDQLAERRNANRSE